jgi:glycosyltransferase involved in cell wall biosynthesis
MERKSIVIHAPNVHIGGGLALLKELLSIHSLPISLAQLDARTKGVLELPMIATKYYVRRSVISRFFAEWQLRRYVLADDVILCFHGLPPLFPLSRRAVVFVQNRILVEQNTLVGYPLKSRIRILIERFWLRAMRRHAFRYIVQTPSMATSLRTLLGSEFEICVFPFASLNASTLIENVATVKKKYDFLYVASGDVHKNHAALLRAWRILAEGGLRPSLALTIDPSSYSNLAEEIINTAREFSLNIVNMGQLSDSDISGLYRSSSALIYPSQTESFGLPLIEAMRHGLPILASELDYVRDVVVPVESFDPRSPVSIARAVRRFLGDAEPTVQIHSAENFLAEVLR